MREQAWDRIKQGLCETVTSSYRDRRRRACLFSDASQGGWAYAITQCEEGELLKPWAEQRHELLCVHSGRFTNLQVNWAMCSKELFPIRKAAEKERHLLQGDKPWLSINDHKALTYLLNEPARSNVVSVAARGRLQRWAAYLRTHLFDTIHIPGEENRFCDLLSRSGCVTATGAWRRLRDAAYREVRRELHPAPQMAIVTPQGPELMHGHSDKDLDVTGKRTGNRKHLL